MKLLAAIFAIIVLIFSTHAVMADSITFNCSCSFEYSQNTITMSVGTIYNSSSSNSKSGAIQLRVLASSTQYSGTGPIRGTILGVFTFPNELRGQTGFPDVTLSIPFNRLPDGTYFVTVTLEEFTSDGLVMQDYHIFPDDITFRDGTSGRDTPVAINPNIASYNESEAVLLLPTVYAPTPIDFNYYSLEMELKSFEPVEFELKTVELLPKSFINFPLTGIYEDEKLIISEALVGTVSYQLKFTLIGTFPTKFRLTAADPI